MAQERGNAQKDTDVTLKLYCRNAGALADPYEVRQVELLDTDGSTVLKTYSSSDITNESTGVYSILVSGTYLDAIGIYYDKWYLTESASESEKTVTQDFYVSETVATERIIAVSDLQVVYAENTPSGQPRFSIGSETTDNILPTGLRKPRGPVAVLSEVRGQIS